MTDQTWDGDERDPEFQRLLQAERAKRGLGRKPAARLLVLGLVTALLGPVVVVVLTALAAGLAGGGSMQRPGVTLVMFAGILVAVVAGVAMIAVGGWRMASRSDSRRS